ncbi:MAG TPA: TetR/AcrR family transcriptional regulator [Polyangiales bacterium]|nr:TetR/AcrR family transcriptional regulator [Polyangiales bacterium]
MRTRTRRSADEARRRILEAAEKQLMKVGPEGLRLTDLAKALRVSHPAILHHFGSREGLVAAVVRHAMQTLSAQLLAALQVGKAATDSAQLIEMVAEVCDQRGLGRLIAWLMLSGRASKLPRATDLPLKQLADVAHALRTAHGQSVSYDDTLFVLQLIATVLLGDAIFGEAVRSASGVPHNAEAARDFRARLLRLLPV